MSDRIKLKKIEVEMDNIGPLMKDDEEQHLEQPLQPQQQQQQASVPWYKSVWQKTTKIADAVKQVPGLIKELIPKDEITLEGASIIEAYRDVHAGSNIGRKERAEREATYFEKSMRSESVRTGEEYIDNAVDQTVEEVDFEDQLSLERYLNSVLQWNMDMFKFDSDDSFDEMDVVTVMQRIKQARILDTAISKYSGKIYSDDIKGEGMPPALMKELRARSEFMKAYSQQVSPRLGMMKSKYYTVLRDKDFRGWDDEKFRREQKKARDAGNNELADYYGAVQLKKKMAKDKSTFQKGTKPLEFLESCRKKVGMKDTRGLDELKAGFHTQTIQKVKADKEEKKKKKQEEEERKKKPVLKYESRGTVVTKPDGTIEYTFTPLEGIGEDYEAQERDYDCFSVAGMKILNHFLKEKGIAKKVTQQDVRKFKPKFKKFETSGYGDRQTYDADVESIKKFLNDNQVTAPGNLYAMADYFLDNAPGSMMRKMVFSPQGVANAPDAIIKKVKDKFKLSIFNALKKNGAVGILSNGHYQTIVGMAGEKLKLLDSTKGANNQEPHESDVDNMFIGLNVELVWLENEDVEAVKKDFKDLKQNEDGSFTVTKEQPHEESVAQVKGIAISKDQTEKDPEIADYYQESVYFKNPKYVDEE